MTSSRGTSLRARRMARNHKRMARPAKLNLVALMDIFTILVLFLIVNNGDVEVLETDKQVVLPESVSEQRPEATLVIKISESNIYLQEQTVSSVDAAVATSQETLEPLAAALLIAASGSQRDGTDPNGRPITIMADRSTSFELLKRIMATCAASDFRDISLAVNSAPLAISAEGIPLAAQGLTL